MKVRFSEKGGEALGEVKYSDFDEVLIPYYDENSAETFITKNFANDANISWKVENIQLSDAEIDISLVKVKQTDSIGLAATKGNATPNKVVGQFNIVEVDFGHKVSAVDSQGQLGRSVLCSGSHLPSELYKKRPCVVLSVNGDRIQVMPLTTSSNSNDPESIEISEESFAKLHAKYTEKTCRTLPRMIQTVSSYRVYPPLLKDGSFPVRCFPYKLNSKDKSSLKEQLAKHFGAELIEDYEVLKRAEGQLRHERGALLKTNDSLKQSLSSLESRFSKILFLLDKVSEEYGLEGEPEEMLKALL